MMETGEALLITFITGIVGYVSQTSHTSLNSPDVALIVRYICRFSLGFFEKRDQISPLFFWLFSNGIYPFLYSLCKKILPCQEATLNSSFNLSEYNGGSVAADC